MFTQTKIGNLNTIYSIRADDPSPPVVLLHGFAGGCGLWVCNWKELAAKHTVYAVDLPGFARSDRVPFGGSTPQEAIDYFMGQLEEWVAQSKIPVPFHLVGHSLGGYLSTQFAYRHPEMVSKLVLADPWGIPEAPPQHIDALPLKYRLAHSVMLNFNPLTALRGLGPLGPEAFRYRRPDVALKYRDFFDDDTIVPDYIFHCNGDTPCGEVAFTYLYHGMVFARLPLETDMLARLDHRIQVTFIYGARTWIDHSAGQRLAKAYAGAATVIYISNAGHNVASDNYAEFTSQLLRVLSAP
jgi:pimeloyl-ACP methyl ester carboxylesterase